MHLRFVDGLRSGQVVEFSETQDVTLGRDASCDLCLEDPRLSRRHCRIFWRQGHWWVQDLKSSNGTWVDGEKVDKARLAPGHVLEIADTVLEVVVDAPVGYAERSAATARPRRSRPGLLILLPVLTLGILFLALRNRPPSTTSRTVESTVESEPPQSPTRDNKPKDPADFLRVVKDPSEGGPTGSESAPTESATDGVEVENETRADYRRRLSLLNEQLTREPSEELRTEVRNLLVEARTELDVTFERARKLTRSGDYDRARELVLDLVPRLPPRMVKETLSELDQLVLQALAARGQPTANRDDRVFLVRDAIARFDFETSEKILRQHRDETAKARGSDEADVDQLARHVRLARSAFEKLVVAVELLAEKAAPIRLSWPKARARVVVESVDGKVRVADEPFPAGPWLIRGFVDGALRLEGEDGEVSLREILTLDDETLEALGPSRDAAARDGPGDGEKEARLTFVEGVSLLLLYREGPTRARGFLNRFEVPVERREELVGTFDQGRSLWLESRQMNLADELKRSMERSDMAAASWDDLASRAALLLVLWKNQPSFAAVRASLEGTYKQIRLERLQRQPPRTLFHASKVAVKGDLVKLRYDFTSTAELEDFHAVGEGSKVALSGGALLLHGECRLLTGAPFEQTLRARLRLPSGGYRHEAPNINVALWTVGEFGVAPRGTLSMTRALMKPRNEPAGYLVFATGYRAVVSEYGDQAFEQVRPVGSDEEVKLPAHVLFAGQSGLPLHSDAGECLWAKRLKGGRLLRAVTLEVLVDEEVCEWRLNDRVVLPEELPAPERLFSGYPRQGSLNLFTIDGELKVSFIEVEGKLNPAWLHVRIWPVVKEELEELLK